MPTVPVYDMEGRQVGEIQLSDTVFGAEVNEPLLHQAVVMYEANRRLGTVDTKTRGEVSGGGRKPWRQKGTGRARHGSIRSPLWVGGGTVWGPHPRNYRQDLPQKARQAALRSALSAKVRSGELVVLDQLALPEAKTRRMAAVLKALGAERRPLIVVPEPDPQVQLATRNIEGASVELATSLNARDVLAAGKLVLTRAAVARVEEALS